MVTREAHRSPAQKQFNLAIENLKKELESTSYIPENWGEKDMLTLEKLAELKVLNHPNTAIILQNLTQQLTETSPLSRKLVNNVIIKTLGKTNMLDPQYVIAALENTYNITPISQIFTPQEDVIKLIINSQPDFKDHPKPNQPIGKLDQNQFYTHLGTQILLIEHPQLADHIIKNLKEKEIINSQTPDNIDFYKLSMESKDLITKQFIVFLSHNQLIINSKNLPILINY